MANGGMDRSTEAPGSRSGTALRDEHDVRHDDDPAVIRHVARPVRNDRVRWGPVWAGLVVTLATYILLQMALIATGALDLSVGGVNEGAILSGIVALVAFVLGGLVTGASARWRNAMDGALNGVVLWGLAIASILVLAFFASGIAAGAFGDIANQFDTDAQELVSDVDAGEATDAAQESAANGLLAITLALIATVVGAVIGAKLWPHDDDEEIDLRERDRLAAGRTTATARPTGTTTTRTDRP